MERRDFLTLAAVTPTTLALPTVAKAVPPVAEDDFRARCERYVHYANTKPGVSSLLQRHVTKTLEALKYTNDEDAHKDGTYSLLFSYFLYGEGFLTVDFNRPTILYPGALDLVAVPEQWKHKWYWHEGSASDMPVRVLAMLNPYLGDTERVRGGSLLDEVDPLLLTDPDFDVYLTDSVVEKVLIANTARQAVQDYNRMQRFGPLTIHLR